MRRHRPPYRLPRSLVRSALALSLALAAAAPPAFAEVKGPKIDGRSVRARRRLIRRARHQRFTPQQRTELAARLKGMSLTDPKFQKEISQAPMSVRLEVFKHHTQGDNAPHVGLRRFRGMLKQDGKRRVAKPHKTFFEVNAQTFETFKTVMGRNVVWFNVTQPASHLHTLIMDQSGDSPVMHHNTYGTNLNPASVNGKQLAFPVQLTDREMDRFVRYLNAGAANSSNKGSVFGFKTGARRGSDGTVTPGQYITDIRCTNWATSAPIGDLPRWVRTVEKRVSGVEGVPEIGRAGSLHAALAKADNKEARHDIVRRVLAHRGLTKWTRSAVKRLRKEFDRHTEKWPNRPKDLVLRKSLASMLGLGRSQDPAKWSYDLAMSKRVPIFAITSTSRTADAEAFKGQTFDMEIMGKIGPDGLVVPDSPNENKGVIPPERRPQSANNAGDTPQAAAE